MTNAIGWDAKQLETGRSRAINNLSNSGLEPRINKRTTGKYKRNLRPRLRKGKINSESSIRIWN
jgi:hypothetical protein